MADIQCFYKPEYHAIFENISAVDNSVILDSSACRVINPGHDIECSWFLLEAAIKRQDTALADFAAKVFDEAFARGWDPEYGEWFGYLRRDGKPTEPPARDIPTKVRSMFCGCWQNVFHCLKNNTRAAPANGRCRF